MKSQPNTKKCVIQPLSENWLPADNITRTFVKHLDHNPSPAVYWKLQGLSRPIKLSVAVPTMDGSRDGYLPKLLEQIVQQDYQQFELIIVKGDPRQGRAINIAAELAQGEFLMTLDDDTSLPDKATFRKLVEVMERLPDIGMAGGNNGIPSDAKPLVKRIMKEIPRRSWALVDRITDSDLAEHPCLIMRTDEFKEIGGENELIPRGLDPYLRMEFRKVNKRVVVIPDVIYHHLPPDTLSGVWQQFRRNGRHAAFTSKNFPEWVIETPSKHGPFRNKVPFIFRAIRFPVRLLKALFLFKPILFLSEISYLCGYIGFWVWPDPPLDRT